MRLLHWAAAAVTVLAACDQGTLALTDTSQTVGRIRVHLTNDPAIFAPAPTPGSPPGPQHLRAAVVWLGLPSPDLFCLQAYQASLGVGEPLDASQTAVAAAGCTDVFSVAPYASGGGGGGGGGVQGGAFGPSVPIKPGETAEIVFDELPVANVFVGLPGDRAAIATVVVYDDRDQSATLGLLQAQLPRATTSSDEMGDGGGPGGGQGGGPGGMMGGPKQVKEDFVYAASFLSMAKSSTRLMVREGQWNLAKLFYPTVGCSDPPQGFTWQDVEGSPAKATCAYSPIADHVVDLAAGPTPAVRDVICRQGAVRYRQAEKFWSPPAHWACVDKNHLVYTGVPGECKAVGHILLKGCQNSATCKEPDWDVSKVPPAWWPCEAFPEPKTK